MWSKYKYFILSGLAFIAIGVIETMKPKETVWLESYSKFDKIPYGNYILFKELGSLFTSPVSPSFESLHTTLADSLVQTNLIVVNNSFAPSNTDIEALLRFVEKGNNAMIISRGISENLLDTLKVSTTFDFSDKKETEISYFLNGDTTLYNGPSYNIHFRSYFDMLSTSTPIGYRSDSMVNFTSLNYGKGTFFLHAVPSAFTNVFMLSENNHEYISKVISFLPDQTTIWDEYYKARKQYLIKSPLEQLLKTDGLRQTFYLIILGTFIYMIFASKRRQRIIPVMPTKRNTTVEFIETMGQLYYNESNHKDIGIKRINYFLADIRERYRIDTENLDEEFSGNLSNHSGVPVDDIERLTKNFNVISTVTEVLDVRIIEQDKLIENFYNKEKAYGKR